MRRDEYAMEIDGKGWKRNQQKDIEMEGTGKRDAWRSRKNNIIHEGLA